MARTQTKPATDVAPHAQTTARTATRALTRPALARARYPRGAAAPVLVEVRRGPFVESRHRGHVVQVDASGRVERGVGDPDYVTSLRSAVKPFGLLALVEAGGVEEFHLTPPELAVMAASHHGEDMHVRTLQGVLRRAGLSQSLLACGTVGAPQDALTAARLARDGEAPGAIRHNCSGFHVSSLLLARHGGWSLDDYWRPDHPSQVAVAEMVARIFGTRPAALVTAVDNCGVLTYAFPLAAIARAFALLADPAGGADAGTVGLITSLTKVRDAMMAAPEMIGGSRDSVDTRVMRTRPGRLVAKGGAEGLRGIGLLPGWSGSGSAAIGVAIKIEDGDLAGRANRSVTIETLAQLNVLDAVALERLNDLHRPPHRDPRGVEISETVPAFQLAPFAELA
jgi:L-asparaginase II